MKKVLTSLFALTALALIAGCSSNNEPKTSSKAATSSSEIRTSISSSDTTTSKESSITSSSSKKSSSALPGNAELKTTSGLTVKFKANGASIDTITWGSTQIAKDGFTVGRCANRIAGGKFSIDGTQYTVSKNDGNNTLHGGQGSGMNSWRGPFATKDWTRESIDSINSVRYSIESADGENGFPGLMRMTVTYTLSEEGELSIQYNATTTKDTLCNPTNHLFINLNGSNNRNYNNIKLQIDADKYTPLSNQLPTGAISSVEGTKFDYRSEAAFKGNEDYDDNYVLNGNGYRKVANMSSNSYKVEVFTDRPGLQLYKAGNGDVCLESQMFPDMINHPEFAEYGTTILRANETFTSKTAYKFSKIA